MFYNVFFFCFNTCHSLSTPLLPSVHICLHSLDITTASDGNHHVLIRDQVLLGEFSSFFYYLRPPGIAVFFFQLQEFLLNNIQDLSATCQNVLQTFHSLQHTCEFFPQLCSFQSNQPLETHVQDSSCLLLSEVKSGLECFSGFINSLGLSDDLDYCIYIIQSN